MQIIARTFLTAIILLLLPLGYGGGLNELKQVLVLLVSPDGFAPLTLGIIILSALHHSSFPPDKKRLYVFIAIAALIVIRVVMFFALGDGSWGSLGMIIFGGIELLCYALIALLFSFMDRIPAEKRDRTRIILFVVLLAIFTLQSTGFLRPGLIE